VESKYDVAVVGAGILGLATARELLSRHPRKSVCVLERESEIGLHQTGRNSGVVHAGIYYAPGSLKARLCVEGARELYEYCDERGIEARRSGKLIVATEPSELPRLDELERRGRANGVPGLRRLDAAGLREIEPHAAGIAALHSPNTGVVDFRAVAGAYAEDLVAAGGAVITECGVRSAEHRRSGLVLRHDQGELQAGAAVFCAGLWADRLAPSSDLRIVPFRGSYARLERPDLVRSMIYPVPDPALPFLGVHLTRHHDGDVLVGPTALLSTRGLGRTLAWPGSWRMFRRWWRTGVGEMRMAVSKGAFARAAARYVPGVEAGDIEPAFHGVRAQALRRDGTLEDDFVFSLEGRALHVRNAPSPAATSSLAIARLIADRADEALDL
jgi:2-hydroxyglutarate dehydrogenase